MRYAVSCLILCLLAACGGGNSPDNSAADKPFIPDFKTPEGATAAYAHAIETMNLELVAQMVVPAEREELVQHYRNNFEVSKKENLRWRLDFDKSRSMYINETAVATVVKFMRLQGEAESLLEESWIVFIQTEDGTWKYSRNHSRQWAAHIRAQEQPDKEPDGEPEKQPDETPKEPPPED